MWEVKRQNLSFQELHEEEQSWLLTRWAGTWDRITALHLETGVRGFVAGDRVDGNGQHLYHRLSWLKPPRKLLFGEQLCFRYLNYYTVLLRQPSRSATVTVVKALSFLKGICAPHWTFQYNCSQVILVSVRWTLLTASIIRKKSWASPVGRGYQICESKHRPCLDFLWQLGSWITCCNLTRLYIAVPQIDDCYIFPQFRCPVWEYHEPHCRSRSHNSSMSKKPCIRIIIEIIIPAHHWNVICNYWKITVCSLKTYNIMFYLPALMTEINDVWGSPFGKLRFVTAAAAAPALFTVLCNHQTQSPLSR